MTTVNVVLTITGVPNTKPAAGIVFDHLDVTLTDSSGTPQTQALPNTTATSFQVTFANVLDGAMTASVVAMDNQGNAIGTPVTGTFNSSTGEFFAPTGLSFAVA